MPRMISIYCLTLNKWRAILDISLTMQYLKYFRQHHNDRRTRKPHYRHKKTRICLYYVENDINLLFDLEQMAAILYYLPTIQCRKYFLTILLCPVYIKTQDRHQKREYISIMSKMISIYCLTLDKWRPSWILYPQCNVENIFWQYHYVRHTWKPPG